jgi:hypothetical protein
MAAGDALGKSGYLEKGAGTKISEYSEQGPFHCNDCIHAIRKDVPTKGKGLCNERHVMKDPQVPTARRSKLKIVDLVHGCCRFVTYPKGYVEDSEDKD